MPNQARSSDIHTAISVEKLPPTPVSVSIMVEDGSVVFRTEDGQALYTYDLDPPGESTCQGDCATQWSPLLAEIGNKTIGDWTTLERTDGSFIWAYRNRVVYFARDNFPNNGNNGPWRQLAP